MDARARLWGAFLALVQVLVWPVVILAGLYWVGRPIAYGLASWMTIADPNEFLKALFSTPTAIVAVLLLIGVPRVRGHVDTLMKRGFSAGAVSVPGEPYPTPQAPKPNPPSATEEPPK